MLIDRPQISEGSVIVNATIASGTAFPSNPDVGELFYLTSGSVGLYYYSGTWDAVAKGATLSTHISDDSRHLTTAQNTLLDGLASTLTAQELNYVDGVTSAIQSQLDAIVAINTQQTTDISNLQSGSSGTSSDLATHIADDSRHLTSAQNTFLDAVTVTSAQVNSIPTLTTNLSTLTTNFNTHTGDDTRHLTSTQNTFLDSVTIGSADVNKLNGLASFLSSGDLSTYLTGLTNNKINRDGSISMTGSLNFGTQKGINLADPTNPTDAANKQYVDSVNVQSVTSASTVTPTFSNDLVKITAQATNLTLPNPTGTAVDGWGIVIRIKDNGTPRTISFGNQYRGIGASLPTTTVANKTMYVSMVYNSDDVKWDVLSVGVEA